MKYILPICPLNDGEGEAGWMDGLDLLLEELKFDDQLPFKDPEEIWEEVGYILDEEELVLSVEQKNELRKIFDGLWIRYQEK